MTISGHILRMAAAANDAPLPTVPGEPFGGGFYAGRIMQSDGEYAIIVAPKSAEISALWKLSATDSPGTSSVVDGLANSNAMNNTDHPAARHCRLYDGGGHSDWYLPAKDELELCYRYLKPTSESNATNSGQNSNSVPPGANYTTNNPGQTASELFRQGGAEAFDSTVYYWTSTQVLAHTGDRQHFSNGVQLAGNKGSSFRVRPTRRVKV